MIAWIRGRMFSVVESRRERSPESCWAARCERRGAKVLMLMLVISLANPWVGSTAIGVERSLILRLQEDPTDATIESWVRQLGDEDFRQRQEAQHQLSQLNQRAFDALYQVRNDGDVERRMAARQLLDRIEIDWAAAEQREDVRRLLSIYGQQAAMERPTTVESISRLEPSASLPALLRIARYEIHDSIAKLAAIRLMREVDTQGEQERDALLAQLRSSLGPGQRTSVRWLRLYCEPNVDVAIEQWESVIEDEQFQVAAGPANDEMSRRVLRDLLRWNIDYLLKQSKPEKADRAATQLTRFRGESREAILESIDWLRSRQLWSAMEQLVDENAQTFAEEALLLYFVAEMRWQTGDESEAERVADKASFQLGDDGRGHLEVASQLREHGLDRWAEREYQEAIAHSKLGSVPDLEARWKMVQLLVKRQQPETAANLLKPVIEAMQNDGAIEKEVSRKLEPAKIESEYEYCRGLVAVGQGDLSTAWDHFVRANQTDPLDTSVLIQLNQIGSERPEWGEFAEKRMQNAFGYYLDQIRFLEQRLGEFEESGVRAMVANRLADYHNRYAWLTVKTVSSSKQASLQEAVEYSLRAVELAPDIAGYHDTLAHGFAALERWDEAIDAQQRAVVLDPHSPAYRDFLKALQQEKSPR